MALYNEQKLPNHIGSTAGDLFLLESCHVAYTVPDGKNATDSARDSVSIDTYIDRLTVLADTDKGKIITMNTNGKLTGGYSVTTDSSNITASATTSIPTSAAVASAITGGFDTANACQFKGTYTAAATSNASAAGGTFSTALTDHSKGWMYIVSGNGYFYNEKVEAGDLIICGEDSTTLTKANFYLIQKNIDPSTYVTLAGEQTITGAKTFNSLTVTGNAVFNSPISGDLLGNATTATKLQSTAAVGSSTVPVYFSGGLPIACGLQTVNGASFAANGDNTAVTMTLTRANSGSSITGNIPIFGGATSSAMVLQDQLKLLEQEMYLNILEEMVHGLQYLLLMKN